MTVSPSSRLSTMSPCGRSSFRRGSALVAAGVVRFTAASSTRAHQPDWRQKAIGAGPPARSDAAMSYDAARGKTLLFGGIGSIGTILGYTWEWDGSTWTQLSPANSPSPRTGHTMAYDTARAR